MVVMCTHQHISRHALYMMYFRAKECSDTDMEDATSKVQLKTIPMTQEIVKGCNCKKTQTAATVR